DGGRGELLVEAGDEVQEVLSGDAAQAHDLLVQAAEGRALVAGGERGRAYAAARVGAVLVEHHAHERLDARQEDRALFELVLVGEGDIRAGELDRPRAPGRIGRGLRAALLRCGPVGRRLDVRRHEALPLPKRGQVTLPP